MMKTTVVRYEGTPSWKSLVQLLFNRHRVVLVNSSRVELTSEVLSEIADTLPGAANLAFHVRVNPGLDSGVRVYRIRNKAAIVLPLLCLKSFRACKALLKAAVSTVKTFAPKSTTLRIPRPHAEIRSGGSGVNAAVLEGNGRAAEHSQPQRTLRPPRPGGVRRWKQRFARTLFTTNMHLQRRLDGMMTDTSVDAGPKLRRAVLVDSVRHLERFAFPRLIHVALTTKCNLKCIMCPYHSQELRKDHTTAYFDDGKRMPPELLDKLIAEAGTHGAQLAFGQYDEPLVYKNFVDYAVKAKDNGCRVSITTNGTLLTEEHAERLISAGVEHISFSLDAATEETYRKIRLSDFAVPLANIQRLVETRNRLHGKTTLRACLVVQDHNRHEQDLFRDRMKAIGLDMVSFYVLSKYENGVWVNERLNFDVDTPEHAGRYACSQLWSQAAVYPDGNVALCCATTMYVGYRDDVPYVGNIRNSSLQEIWVSQQYSEIRREALSGVFKNSVCRDCQIWHNSQHRETRDVHGHRVQQNPYETFVHLDDVR